MVLCVSLRRSPEHSLIHPTNGTSQSNREDQAAETAIEATLNTNTTNYPRGTGSVTDRSQHPYPSASVLASVEAPLRLLLPYWLEPSEVSIGHLDIDYSRPVKHHVRVYIASPGKLIHEPLHYHSVSTLRTQQGIVLNTSVPCSFESGERLTIAHSILDPAGEVSTGKMGRVTFVPEVSHQMPQGRVIAKADPYPDPNCSQHNQHDQGTTYLCGSHLPPPDEATDFASVNETPIEHATYRGST